MGLPLSLTLTQAGLDALVDAQNGVTAAIVITELGLSEQQVAVAPTLDALPGEFKRLDSFAGISASETIIHMTAQDASQDIYDLRSIGLFLDDGTLFAAYSQADPIFRKVDIATFLVSFDVLFSESITGDIEFGDAAFLYPPATEQTKGVAEIATQGETDAGEDDSRIVSPAKLAARLAPVLQAIADEEAARADEDAALQDQDDALHALIVALRAITITGGGLVTGGGNLIANRVLQVTAASAAQVRAGTSNATAITPAALGPMTKSLGLSGYATVPGADPANTLLIQWGRATATANGTTSVTFPIAFTDAYSVVADGTSDTNNNAQDNYPAVRAASIGPTGFQVFNANETADAICYVALGRIDMS